MQESTKKEDKKKIVETLYSLKEIPGIVEFSAGLNQTQEGKSKGFEVGMRIGFQNQAALDVYLPHPIHKSVIGQVSEHSLIALLYSDYTW